MKPNVFAALAAHFSSVADELRSQANQAGLLENSSAVGTEREDMYRAFLERHLPKMCEVFLGGYIFDMKGQASLQIDVIVTNGNTPRFQMPTGSRYIAPLEGTIGVAEVKSRLDKNSLQDALRKCASIPLMPDSEGLLAPDLRMRTGLWQDMPYKIVFAYNGLKAETILRHIEDFYVTNADILVARRPNIIHVLGKYAIVKVDSTNRIVDEDGKDVPFDPNIGSYRIERAESDVSAISWILSYLHQKNVFYNNVIFNYTDWHTMLMDRITKAAESG